MRFKCYNCNIQWVIPKEALVYMSDWPDTCPDCGSTNIGHETVEKAITSSGALENVADKEPEEIERKKNLRKCSTISNKGR